MSFANVNSLARFFTHPDPGLIWACGLLAAVAYILRSARRAGLDPRAAYWASVVAIVLGLIGGRLLGLYYYSADSPWSLLRLWEGGQAQYGNVIGATVGLALFFKVRKLPFLAYADAIAPAAALAVSIGRVACFVNGDDFGTLSNLPWAVRFPAGTEAYADHLARGWITPASALSLPVHPVQLYCALFWLALFVALVYWRPALPGLRLGVLAIAHGAGRIAEQCFRGDFERFLGPLSLTQVISVVLIVIGLAIVAHQLRIKAPDHRLVADPQCVEACT